MKTKINLFYSAALSGAAVVFACFTLLNPCAQAADQLWIGSAGEHNVTTAGNWVGGAPVLDQWDPFVFGSDVVNGTMNLDRWIAIHSITVNSGCTQPIAITDGGPIIMGGSLVDMSSAGVDLTCSAQFQQGWGDMTFNVGAGRTLTAAGGVGEAHWFHVDNDLAKDFLHTGLTKNGAGTAVITAASVYTLGTTINAGTLTLSGAGGLPTASAVNLSNWGAALDISGISAGGQTIGSLSGVAGTSVALGGKNLNVGGDNTSTTFDGVILLTGGSLTKAGSGTMTLGSGVSGSGTITANGGTIQAAEGNWHQENLDIVVNSGATFTTSAGNSRALSWTLNGGTVNSRGDDSPTFWGNMMLYDSQAVTVGGSAVSTIASHVMLGAGSGFAVGAGSTLNMTGAISNSVWAGGSGSFIKTGGGTLTLSNANNNYTGATTINAGSLVFTSVAAVGSTSGIIVNNGGSLDFDSGTAGGTISTPISLNGDGAGNAALDTFFAGNQITFTAPITLLGDSLIRAVGNNVTMNFTNAIDGTGDLNFAAFGGGAGAKDFMVLSGASQYTGNLVIINWYGSAQVTLSGGDNRLPTTALVAVKGSAGTPGALDLNGNNQTIAGLSDAIGWGGVDAGTRSVVNTSGTAVTLTLNTTADQSSGVTIGGTDINGTTGNNLSLVKTGANTQTLTGANTYSGNTTVNGGTLSLGQVNSNNESSTVSIATTSGAKLNLAFSGTDTVGKLYINGVQQPAGNYTSAHASGTFTGGGTLQVTSGSGFTGWITGSFAKGSVPGGQQGPNDDPDHDGVSNLMEYAIAGEDPTAAKATIGTFDGSTHALTFTKRQPLATDLTYVIETSPNLQPPWTARVTQTPSNTDATISYALPTGQGALFARLRVQQ